MPPKSRRKRISTRKSNQFEENTSNPTGQSGNSPAEENVLRRTRSRSRNTTANDENSRKKRRMQAQSPPEQEAKIQKSSDGKVRDIFCWVCHKIGGVISCESCPRVYHSECLKKLNNRCDRNIKCECNLKSVDGKKEELKWDPLFLKRMLQYVMDRAIKPDTKRKSSDALKTKFSRFFHTWLAESEKLCKIMDIAILIDNMNGDEPYLNTGQFYMDVKWLYHNCYIFYGTDHEFTDLAKKFESNIKLELTDLEVCGECYRSKVCDKYDDSFTGVCSNPHQIIWAKLRGSPYWPAKCMDIQNGHAEVRFFGTHDRANIMTKNCFKISQSHPFNRHINKTQYNNAMQELSIYISNYRSIHGELKYYDMNTPLEDNSPKKTNQQKMGQSSTLNRRPSTTESADKKTSVSFCNVNNFNENERNQNISESVSENGIVYHSSFTTHEQEPNNSYEFLSNSSENFGLPQSSLNPVISLSPLEETSLQSTANLIVARADMDGNLINCSNKLNSSASNKESLPVITSTHSSTEIPHGSQLAEPNIGNSFPIISSTSSATNRNIDFASRGIPIVNENGEMETDEPQISNMSPQLRRLSALREQIQNLVTQNNLDAELDEQDSEEEIQVISEETKNQSIMKNPAILKAIAEILFASKPNIRNRFIQLQEKFLFVYICMYIDAYSTKFDSQDIKLFLDVCNRCLKKNQILEKDNAELRKEIKKLQDDVKRLEEEKEARNNMDSQKKLLKDVIIQKASEKMRRNDSDGIQLQKYKEKEMCLNQENESLKYKLKEAKEKAEIKDKELSFLRDTRKKLMAELTKCNENFKNVRSIEVQTEPIIKIISSQKNLPSEYVSSKVQQPYPLMEYSSNTTDDETGSEEQEDTQTTQTSKSNTTDNKTGSEEEGYTQIIQPSMQREIRFQTRTVECIFPSDDSNVNDTPQTFEANGFMANFNPPLLSSIAVSVPPLLPIVAPQGPIFLNSESSASFLDATIPDTDSSKNLDGPMKTYMNWKKKNY